MPWHFSNWNNWYNWYNWHNFSNSYLNANNDTALVDEDGTVTFDVLSNDFSSSSMTITHVNGTTLAIGDVITLSGGGELTYTGGGVFTFDPNDSYDWLGDGQATTETFQYTVRNSQGYVRTQSVSIDVTGSNDGPTALADTGGTGEDSSVVLDVLANDSDPDANDTLIVTSATMQSGLGTVTVAPGGSSISYDPGAAYQSLGVGETATVEILYEISDGNGGTSTALATVTVTGSNDGPTALADTFGGTRGADITGNVLADNGSGADFDIDGDPLTVLDGQYQTAQGGTVIMQADGTFVYSPDAYFVGEDSFQYTLLDDQGGATTGEVTFVIDPQASDTAGSNSDDLIVAGNGIQSIFGLGGDDTIRAGNADDVLGGGAGDDNLFGENGDDLLIGGSGDDTLVGGRGEDILIGGGGADSFIFERSHGSDIVEDFELGVDQLVVAANLKADSFDELTLTQVGDDTFINIGGASVTLVGVTASSMTEDDFLFL